MSNMYVYVCSAVVPRVCSADLNGSMTSSLGICGYIFVIATLKLIYVFN
jgi:hypothetical protein